MTEETRESYDSGEVVWVKLGSSWWPGEVKNADELPSEVLDFKKPPLVIVKFFDEDSYEYVKSWVNIFPFNCEKKNEFIKKGMAAFRAKVPHMEKFPKDVLKAEEKVGGNLNILSDPQFLPEKKRNYAAEVFGTPSPKTKTPKNKKRSSSNKSGGKKDTSHITHRRFLGADDYRAYICIQYPGKDRVPGDREDDEVIRINREPEQDFNCHSCSFTTKRLEVMILHTKSHIQGVYLSSARKNKQTVSRRRREKSKKPRGSNVESESSSSDSEPVRQRKRKPKTQGAKNTKIKKVEEEQAPKKDVRTELLEAWDDSEEEEEELDTSLDKTNETAEKTNRTLDESSETVPELTLDESLKKSDPNQNDNSSLPAEAKSPSQMIEEALNNVSGELGKSDSQNETVTEPLSTEKLLSALEDDSMDAQEKNSANNTEKKPDDEMNDADQKSDTEDDASRRKMNRDMQEAIKSCFDFDEDEEEDNTIVSKAASGRKIPRVIPKVSRKKSTDGVESDKPEPEEDMNAAFKELMEKTAVPDLPEVQNTLKCEQNFHNIKTIKFPDKPERKDSTEVATKLTNPKKRFVKSFEDFELMQNEIRRREEEQLDASKHEHYDEPEMAGSTSKCDYLDKSEEQYSPDSNIQLSKLKSKIMSKIIEEAKINAESKNKIMSKMQESKQKVIESETAKVKNVEDASKAEAPAHRTPRSKILESYMKDSGKTKVEAPKTEEVQDRLKSGETEKESVPPKKSRWSRRGSHPKKDRNLFALQDENATLVEKQEETPASEATSDEAPKTSEETKPPTPIEETVSINEVVDAPPPVKELETTEPHVENVQTDESDSTNKEEIKEISPKVNEEIKEDVKPTTADTEMETKHEPQEEAKTNDAVVEIAEKSVETSHETPQVELETVPNEETVTAEKSQEVLPVEEIPLPTTEETSVVPLKETETVVEQTVAVTEEDNEISAPITDSALPTDAIVSPPKKSKKRKMSDYDAPSPVEVVPPEESPPLEKKIKEDESVKEIELTLPPPETSDITEGNKNSSKENTVIETKTETEPTVEIEKAKDSEKIEECATQEVPVCEKEDIAASETQEVSGETQEISEPEDKLDVEKDVGERDVITKEAENVCENDSKLPEPEIPPEKDVETIKTPPSPSSNEHNNEVEIQCASSSVDSFKFSIQTNLSILSSREEMSALALATLSEIKADLESNEEPVPKEKETKPVPPALLESEMVPIEGNLTVVSEKDLADGQVEITSEQVISPKRPVTLSNFSLDFSDSLSDSNSSTADTLSDMGKSDFNSKGTEFTAKALTRQMKKLDQKKESTYGRLELLNILEGNSDTEKKSKEFMHPAKKANVVEDICDFEEHIPSQIVCAKTLKKDASDFDEKPSKTSVKSTTSKLLERLTTESKAKASATKTDTPPLESIGKLTIKGQTITVNPKNAKYIGKSKPSKPIILSEQIVKQAPETPKNTMEDIEDVEAFVIHKDPNKQHETEETAKSKGASTKTAGKAKILQQTIITPAGEIIQPNVAEAQTDDNIFDINSMPIVLSDEILTPESIEKMPIVIGSDTKTTVVDKIVKRPAPSRITTTPNKTITITKHKPPRILQSFGNKVVKNSPLLPNTAKPGKYIIVPQSSIPQTKYVAKKPTVVKKTTVSPGVVQKIPSIAPESTGNKIMIVTNQQGQQQRLLLTPAQQKMLGYQNQKVTKTLVKGNVMQKSVLATKTVPLVEAGTSGVTKTPTLIGQKVVVGTGVGVQGRITKTVTKRSPASPQKLSTTVGKPQKMVLIKNQHGQTVRKIQGTDDELLDKQVAEQLKAIKASSGMKFSSQQKPAEADKTTLKFPTRRSYSKRVETKPRGPPPLAGLQQTPKQEVKKAEIETKPVPEETKPQSTERPLNQLVIQDAVGNQTTITEGQILALPSETVDGQPQSYMLVTLDESGNLTPLNSEALMSLDPNLGLGGDLSNMVLQIDQGGLSDRPQTAVIKPPEPVKSVEVESVPEPTEVTETVAEQKPVPTPVTENLQAVATSTNGEPGQQLIVTGDPIATQKFLESLTEGTTDLANILANAEGNSILIQADGQQILINTNTDNQMLLSMNNDSANVTENTEGGGNPIFSTQPSKNQDILAAALADTDVFQQEHPNSTQSKIVSQLSPNNALYPMNVGNVLETSLTLSSPIMTPLEVPSTNNKKIPDDEADILTQVPKNVDLPITITDPNISQTVANQQLIANELQTNLELALPISETTISTVSTEMNSPSYAYSLPALDESVEMTQKPFNGSMPLLNEDVDETAGKKTEVKTNEENAEKEKDKSFLAEEEGRFTLGGEMCSSLSEPPPEMFDLPEVNQNFAEKSIASLQSTPEASDNASKDEDTTDLSHADTSSEGSCEIPLQPQIVTKSLDLSRNLDSLKRSLSEAEEENKKCKFD